MTAWLIAAILAQTDYSPFQDGAEWVYKTREGDVFTVKVAGREKLGGYDCFRVETTGPIRTTREWVAVTDQGELVARRERYRYDPAYPRLKYPLKDGARWEFEVTKKSDIEEDTKVKGTYEVLGVEDLTVRAGSFTCYKVRWVIEESGGAVDGVFWVASGVGVVKKTFSSGGQELVWELETFSAGSAGGSEEYFPLKVGTRWTYDTPDGTMTWEIKGREKVGEVECWILEQVLGERRKRQWILANKDGVWKYREDDKTLEKPEQMLKYPLKAGVTWSAGKGSYEVVGELEVEVKAGKYKCLRVMYRISDRKIADYYYARDIGLVKSDMEVDDLKLGFQLVKFERGKD